MDVLDVLADDHRRMRHTVARLFEPGADRGTRMHLYAELARELNLHGQLEEDLFYPAAFPEEQSAVRAHSDHRTINGLLSLLDQCPFAGPEWERRLRDLRDAVEQHVIWEERELFPLAEGRLPAADRRRLAEQMQAERDRLTGLRGSVEDLMT